MKARKKMYDLEKKKREISEKLDKFDYSYNKEQKKVNNKNEILDKDNNGNIESCAKIDKDYQKVLDKRLEDIMDKINDNIINQNNIDFYNFLLKGRPKYYKSQKKENGLNKNDANDDLNKNKNKNGIKDNDNGSNNKIINNKNIQKNEDDDENERYEGEFDNININDIDNKNVNNLDNKDNNLDNDNNILNNNNFDNNNLNNDNNNLNNYNINIGNNINIDNNNINDNNQLKKYNIPPNLNVHISYNWGGNINLEEMKNQNNIKQQNNILAKELTSLKDELNKTRKENNKLLQELIYKKGMIKNTNILDNFVDGFMEKLSLNWDEIVNNIIDEIINGEIQELNEIELNKMKYKQNKNKMKKNLYNSGLGGIVPNKNEQNTNEDFILDNIELIKKIVYDVNENENNVKIKYNLK